MEIINKIEINIIVATDLNGVFSADGKIPWHIPEDLKRFKDLTTGHAVIMGRKTWESLPIKPLPNRDNLVLCSNPFLTLADTGRTVLSASSLIHALEWAYREHHEKAFIIGGQELYKEALPMADNIYLTVVNTTAEGNNKRYFRMPNTGFEKKEQTYRNGFWTYDYARIKR